MKFKKFFILLIIFNLCLGQIGCCSAQTVTPLTDIIPNSGLKTKDKTLQGGVNYDEQEENPDLFTGKVEEVRKGSKLKMTVSSVISSEGNQAGDEFFAEVTDDFSAGSGIVIPAGTLAHGTVTKVENSKRLGRSGYVNVKFDYLITPDNRKIPVDASMTTKRHPATETAKVVLEDTAYTVAGGVVGGLIAFKFLGMGAAVASKGGTIAGGAGIGATIGLISSLIRRGDEALIAPGDQIRVNIVQGLDLPVLTEAALKDKELVCEGLNVKITDYILGKDPFGELNTITIALDIENKTQKTFSSFDMALMSEYKTVYYPSPFGDTELWFFKVKPGTRVKGKISFSVDSPKKKHWLVFYDSQNRKPLAKFSLANAERELKKQKTEKKKGK